MDELGRFFDFIGFLQTMLLLDLRIVSY